MDYHNKKLTVRGNICRGYHHSSAGSFAASYPNSADHYKKGA